MKFYLLFCLGLMLSAQAAAAQFGFDGDGLIDVKAQEATYKGSVTVLTGDVIVKQGEAVITSDKMTIYRAETANSRTALKLGEITRIVAEGKFVYDAPNNKITGERGIYKRTQNQLDVFGSVVLTQSSGNQVASDSLFYDLKTKSARFKSESGRTDFSLGN